MPTDTCVGAPAVSVSVAEGVTASIPPLSLRYADPASAETVYPSASDARNEVLSVPLVLDTPLLGVKEAENPSEITDATVGEDEKTRGTPLSEVPNAAVNPELAPANAVDAVFSVVVTEAAEPS